MPDTTIASISLYQLRVPLREPFVISLGPLLAAENLVVVLRTAGGLVGYGECSPFPTINGESVDTGFIVGQYFAQALKGRDALDLAGNLAEMDRIIYGNSSIKSAFDIALHDIAARHAGLPLYEFLGGKNDKILTTDMTVSLGPPDKMQADAVQLSAGRLPGHQGEAGRDAGRRRGPHPGHPGGHRAPPPAARGCQPGLAHGRLTPLPCSGPWASSTSSTARSPSGASILWS